MPRIPNKTKNTPDPIGTPSRPLLALALALVSTLQACAAWPGLDDPAITIAPEFTLLRLSGETRMQSGSPPIRNSALRVADLGAGDREDNVGASVTYGDGFSGFDLHYSRIEADSSKEGLARDDWGNVPLGTAVDTRVALDDFHVRYIAGLFHYEGQTEEDWFKAGLGVQLAHRDMSFDVRSVNSAAGQKIQFGDDVSPMLAARLAVRRGPFGLSLNVAYNDWSLGTGELEGAFYDLSARASYYLEAPDLTIFGGYRRFDLPARGNEGTLEYDVDFTVDGYVFGFEFVF